MAKPDAQKPETEKIVKRDFVNATANANKRYPPTIPKIKKLARLSPRTWCRITYASYLFIREKAMEKNITMTEFVENIFQEYIARNGGEKK